MDRDFAVKAAEPFPGVICGKGEPGLLAGHVPANGLVGYCWTVPRD